jgi:Trk-type K+ transport system membrane component
MINPGFYKDPARTLTMGLIMLLWGTVFFLFHEHLLFRKQRKTNSVPKWEKLFFQVCSGMIIFGGVYQVCVGAWVLLTQSGLHQ